MLRGCPVRQICERRRCLWAVAAAGARGLPPPALVVVDRSRWTGAVSPCNAPARGRLCRMWAREAGRVGHLRRRAGRARGGRASNVEQTRMGCPPGRCDLERVSRHDGARRSRGGATFILWPSLRQAIPFERTFMRGRRPLRRLARSRVRATLRGLKCMHVSSGYALGLSAARGRSRGPCT